MMTTQVMRALALKEWAAVIDALQRGEQIVTLRKGGIREKAFLVEGRSFFLLPTFEHQATESIKQPFHAALDGGIAAHRNKQGLMVRNRADLVGLWEIDEAKQLAALIPFQLFTEHYARSRFDWRPKQALTVLLLRVYRLTAPWQTGLPVGSGGCRSWLEVDPAGVSDACEPVLSDAQFALMAAQIRDALGQPFVAG